MSYLNHVILPKSHAIHISTVDSSILHYMDLKKEPLYTSGFDHVLCPVSYTQEASDAFAQFRKDYSHDAGLFTFPDILYSYIIHANLINPL